jgi:two-component system sensor histidine kinase/response regulator
MSDHLSKPLEPAELLRVLSRWAKYPSPQPAASPAPPSPGEKTAANQIFDRAGLLKRVLGDTAIAEAVVSGFLSDMPDRVAELQKALAAGDCGTAARLAHLIKGAASNVGGLSLRAVALEIETAAKVGNLSLLKNLQKRLLQEFDLLKQKLAQNGQQSPPLNTSYENASRRR